MAAFFKCKVCGNLHASPIGLGDKKSFDTTTLKGNGFQRPKTGKMETYDKKDMIWKD